MYIISRGFNMGFFMCTLCSLVFILLLHACHLEEKNSQGKLLAQKHCGNCHVVPRPSALDQLSWSKVMSQMKREMEKAQYFVDSLEWITVQQYYFQESPKQLPLASGKQKLAVNSDWQMQNRGIEDENMVSAITMLDAVTSNEVFAGDVRGNIFSITEGGTELVDSLESIPMEVMRSEDILFFLAMDNLMPSTKRTGKIIAKRGNEQKIEIDSLDRPIDFHISDLDHDAQVEFIVANFGSTIGTSNTGDLSIYGYDSSGTFSLKFKKEMPGAVRLQVLDYDHDGDDDIFCLFAQGQETLFYFENNGDLSFEEYLLIQLNPEYGSNDFLMADMDNDEDLDIVLTNGDNGDNTQVHKPYHGLRIFENQGALEFTESVFYPIHGASRVLTTDHDADGDLDLIVLSMYPDLASFPEEVLLYFENEGRLRLAPSYFFDEPDDKWMLMTLADLDLNGINELILGANQFIQGVLVPPRFWDKWNDETKIVQVWQP